MTGVAAFLLRALAMVAGYAAASLAASGFLHLLFLGAGGFAAEDVPWLAAGSLVFSVPFVALFVAYFAFLPSVPVILVAEFFGRRDWLTYAIGGALVGLAVAGLFWQAAAPIEAGIDIDPSDAAPGPMLSDPRAYALMIGGGIVGGLAYWLVAGRSAMGWRR